jgi:glycosyltransferase involved in cell wall biosynthesis
VSKIYIKPHFDHIDRADGGIRRVVEAQEKYLPKFGWDPAKDEKLADLIAVHGGERSDRTDVPIVSHNHGLMWDRYEWDNWAHEINAMVVESLRCAVSHTAPSFWVSDSLRRGMMIYPEVIYHGVDAEEFSPPEKHDDYILWNKARVDAVSNPNDMEKVARLLPSRKFLSTFGTPATNLQVTGPIAYDEMKKIIRSAGVYLATTRETFGIGTLEALACGVPVAGWAWGGQTEIIRQGETGYLAPPGDYKALADAIELCFVNRGRLSINARVDVMKNWLWEDKIQQYAALYDATLGWWQTLKPKVSVIVTCHNLAKYLPDALNSVLGQSLKDWECIIVDDDSNDSTPEIGKDYEKKDKRFRYFRTRFNMKLTGSRNMGVKRSTGRYIMMLDADDMLTPTALEVLTQELDKNSRLHIGYGHLDLMDDDGKNVRRNEGWPFDQFNWFSQMAHYNQLPYCAMMRREVFEQCGGYRQRQWRAEDAEFWSRATSFGFRAEKVTQASTLIYRNRSDSKSKGEDGDGNWLGFLGWSIAAKGMEVPFRQSLDGHLIKYDIVPFGAQPKPFGKAFWPIRDQAYPKISVIIPVSEEHERMVIDALDSLIMQDFQDWEAIVVNDSGREWKDGYGSPVWGAPFAKVIKTEGKNGPAHARNLGVRYARGEALLFLDADDHLTRGALSKWWRAYLEGNGSIIYSDWWRDDQDGKDLVLCDTDDFRCGDVLEKMRHAVTALVPHEAHLRIGGFDESLPGWEDWDYYIALQAAGLCSYRLPEPLFVYRFRAGARREESFGKRAELLQLIHDKWLPYYDGRTTMAACQKCPGGQIQVPSIDYGVLPTDVNTLIAEGGETVLIEYQGEEFGPVRVVGKTTGSVYKFGQSPAHRQKLVYHKDAAELLSRIVNGRAVFALVSHQQERV